MPLALTDFIQVNSGGFNAASGSATLPVGTTAGNTVLVLLFTHGPTVTPLSGFAFDRSAFVFNNQRLEIYRRSNVPADETSWTITLSASAKCAWVACEVESLDLLTPLNADAFATTTAQTGVSTGTTGQTIAVDGVCIAAHGVYDGASATSPTWSNHSAGFAELAEQGANDGSTSVGLSVSLLFPGKVGTFSATADNTVSGGGPCAAAMVVYASATSAYVPQLRVISGFEFGTTAGLVTGPTGNRLASSTSGTGTVAVTTSTPRTGSYCLELSATSAAIQLRWDTAIIGGSKQVGVARLAVRFPTSLPSGDVELARFFSQSSLPASIWYRTSTTKLGAVISTGTEQASAATVTTDTWYGIDLRYDLRNPTHTLDWQIDATAQTQATLDAGSGSTLSYFALGWADNATATVRYDDLAVGTGTAGEYPLGDLRVHPLTVDPAGTLTLGGGAVAADFNTFSANGTLASWDATTARGAIDEIPPTIGGTADGLVQVTGAASNPDHVEIPLTSYQAAPNASIRGVRMLACGWAQYPTPVTFGMRSWDGAAEQTLYGAADPNFDASTTDPAWVCAMVPQPAGWTQAKLDALAVRVGYRTST